MIPLGDEGTPAQRGLPIVNLSIIALCIVMYIAQVLVGDSLTYGWSLIPREITTGQDLVGIVPVPGFDAEILLTSAPLGIPYLTLLTSIFMHGGWLHLGSNMLFLFIFGDNVEDNFGPFKYLFFYVVCGLAASFAQIVMAGPDEVIPNLGASGAIAGVMAAYLVMFRQARIRAIIPMGRVATVGSVPAIVMIGFWIVAQFLSAFVLQEQAGGGGGVAYWAHIGGFVAGLLLVFVLRDTSRDMG